MQLNWTVRDYDGRCGSGGKIVCTRIIYIYIYIGCGPLPGFQWPPGLLHFLIGNPYKPSFATVAGRGPHPIYTLIIHTWHNYQKNSLRGTSQESGVVVSSIPLWGLVLVESDIWREWYLKRFWGERNLKYPAPRKVAQGVREKLQWNVSISGWSCLLSPLQELFSAKQLHCFKLKSIHVAESS